MSPEAKTGPAWRIAEEIRAQIKRGEYQPGDRLPSRNELIERHGISYKTAGKAIAHLVNAGLVTTRYGSGAYVRGDHEVRVVGPHRYSRAKWAVTTTEAHQDETGQGEPITRQGGQTQEVRREPADELTAAKLGVEPGAEVVVRDRVMTSDGQRTHTMTSYYRPEDVAGTPIEDQRPGIAGGGGGFAVFTERGLEPRQMTERIFARMPTAEEMNKLGLPPGEPVVELHRTTRTEAGQVIEFARGVHSASRFAWEYTFDIPD
ncbi:GntR family transcriptional regulator [Microtetraspora malaysiensis]|uniref:GntR family transcriptional regulator n=1 Tax=Microtetraspora malaysiensis TaxID=161358 RepID=UPI003D912978